MFPSPFSNVCATALEWLIEHPSPVDLVDGSGDAPDVSVSTKCAINVKHVKLLAFVQQMKISSISLYFDHLQANTTNNIESLLEIIRIYGQRNSPPSAEAIQLFIDMGFEEALAREALRVVGNHHSLACEWLVGNRSKVAFDRSDGSPFDLHVLKILLDSPHIQLGLSSPKIFFGLYIVLILQSRCIVCRCLLKIFSSSIFSWHRQRSYQYWRTTRQWECG